MYTSYCTYVVRLIRTCIIALHLDFQSGMSYLHFACASGQHELITQLVEREANVNAVDLVTQYFYSLVNHFRWPLRTSAYRALRSIPTRRLAYCTSVFWSRPFHQCGLITCEYALAHIRTLIDMTSSFAGLWGVGSHIRISAPAASSSLASSYWVPYCAQVGAMRVSTQ